MNLVHNSKNILAGYIYQCKITGLLKNVAFENILP
jgi:hypothetical protein